MTKSKLIAIGAAVLLAVGFGALLAPAFDFPITYTNALVRVQQNDYERGVNDALDAIILLDLEQNLTHTNRTWGAMAEVVCERLKVKRHVR